MTTNEQSLEGLIERVKAATGPDRELECDLVAMFFGRAEAEIHRGHYLAVHCYTASIDAALALVERLLPGWHWNIGHDANGELHATIWHGVAQADEYAPTAPLAILLALLSALKDASE